jgi:hypothetical protein
MRLRQIDGSGMLLEHMGEPRAWIFMRLLLVWVELRIG